MVTKECRTKLSVGTRFLLFLMLQKVYKNCQTINDPFRLVLELRSFRPRIPSRITIVIVGRRIGIRPGIVSKFPRLSTESTRVFRIGRLQPLAYALQVKGVAAPAPHYRTVFSRKQYPRTRSFKRSLANAADVVTGVPRPVGDGVVPFEFDLYGDGRSAWTQSIARMEGCLIA